MIYNFSMGNYNRSWYENNKERILARQKEVRRQSFEAMTKEELEAYKQKEREKNRLHYQQNRDRILQYKKKYAENNKEKINESRRKTRSKIKDWSYTKRKYDITKDQYDEILKSQNYVCAICQKPEKLAQKGKPIRLAIDHCHKSGIVRGLLCAGCNTSLGKFDDNISILERAIEYLRKFNESNSIKP
jgi:hypothetical protein